MEKLLFFSKPQKNKLADSCNDFLTGVPKIFVVRLMGQVSQLIAGGVGRKGEKKGRVLPVYNVLLREKNSGPSRGQGAKNIFSVFARSYGLN